MSAVAAAGPPAFLACPNCGQALSGLASDHFVRCGNCRTELSGQVFPAFAAAAMQPIQSGARAMEGDAVCFFHPQKRAEQSCARCGRFVCGLCEMPIGNEYFCPTCLSNGMESGSLEELVPKRVVWGQLALLLGAVPLLLGLFVWPGFIITGPAAFGIAIYGWSKPGSLVRGRRRVAASFGLFFGLVQIAIFAGMVFFIWQAFSSL